MVSHHYSSCDIQSKQKQHRINRWLLRIFQMCSILVGYKNWCSYGHPKTLGQMNHGILGTCDSQYCTGTRPAGKSLKLIRKCFVYPQWERFSPFFFLLVSILFCPCLLCYFQIVYRYCNTYQFSWKGYSCIYIYYLFFHILFMYG